MEVTDTCRVRSKSITFYSEMLSLPAVRSKLIIRNSQSNLGASEAPERSNP